MLCESLLYGSKGSNNTKWVFMSCSADRVSSKVLLCLGRGELDKTTFCLEASARAHTKHFSFLGNGIFTLFLHRFFKWASEVFSKNEGKELPETSFIGGFEALLKSG